MSDLLEVEKEAEQNLAQQDALQEKESVVKEAKDDGSYTPEFSIREMLEAGVHFGHRTARWNAKMLPYIYGVKDELHIIDLQQSAYLLANSVKLLREIIKRHGKILFVCTKKQGAGLVAKVANDNNQYHVTNKWLGGMLTNWKTISKQIKTLNEAEVELADPESPLTKKEKLMLSRKQEKLIKQLGGIRNMTKLPDILFVIDTPREALAIAEAKALGIPVMAIVDTNSDPDLIDYKISGNDDSIKAIDLYMKVINDALQSVKDCQNINTEKQQKETGIKKSIMSKKSSKNLKKKEE